MDEILEQILAAQQANDEAEVKRIFIALSLEQQAEFIGFYDTALTYDSWDNEAQEELAAIVRELSDWHEQAKLTAELIASTEYQCQRCMFTWTSLQKLKCYMCRSNNVIEI